MNATIHEQLYILALVYTNDIERLKALNESGVLSLDFNFSYKIPIPSDCSNIMDVLNELLLINGFFTNLNDFMYNNRLFQILFMQNRIETLKLNPSVEEVLFKINPEPDESTLDQCLELTPISGTVRDSIEARFFEMSLLKVAVLMEYEEMVKYLLESGAHVVATAETNAIILESYSNHFDINPIHLSIYQNNFQILKILLNELSNEYIENKSINELLDHNGLNPLHLAIYNQCTKSMRLLHKRGADINHITETVKFPLIWAMETYEISDEVIEVLLEMNVETNKVDVENTLSPLIVAIVSDRYELVKLLIKYGADVNQKFDDSYTNPVKIAIDYYRENQNGELILRALLEAGACLNYDLPDIINNSCPALPPALRQISLDEDGFDHIMYRIQLLSQTNELNMNRSFRRYPLIFAIYIGYQEIVKLLLEYGAYPHTTKLDYYSPLSSACHVGNLEIVDLLLEFGVDPTSNCYQSNTPLTISIAKNDMVLIMRLLKYYTCSKSLNIQDSNGDFALLYASYNRNAMLVKKLLEQGAEPDLFNKHNANALWYSVYNNDKPTFFELIKYATDFETKSYGIDYQNFDTIPQIIYDNPAAPIIVAEFNHYYDMVYYLYCIGANVSMELRKRIRFKYSDLTVENREYEKLKILNKLLNQPLSLARICRKSIRKRIKFVDWHRYDGSGGLLSRYLKRFLSLEII